MITTAEIKLVKSLQQKKFRKAHELFVVEGDKMVAELISSGYEIAQLFALEDWAKQHNSATARILKPKELERITHLSTPNQALALVRLPQTQIRAEALRGKISLALDNIQDPGNLGTIIRTADWFGIEHIICSETTADLFNPKVIQATMGSFMRVKLMYTPLQAFLQSLPEDFPLLGTVLKGTDLYQQHPPSEGLIITGNESRGISPEIEAQLSHRLTIPLYHQEGKSTFPESLNAGVATGIVLAWARQAKTA